MKKLLIQTSIFIALLAIPLSALGAGNELIAQVKIDPSLKPEFAVSIEPKNESDRTAVVNIILQLIAGSLIYAAGPIAVFMLALGGLRYTVSHGDQNQMEEAKKTILWAIIGLVVIIFSMAIITNIINIIDIFPSG